MFAQPWEMLTRNVVCSLTSVFMVENLSKMDLFAILETNVHSILENNIQSSKVVKDILSLQNRVDLR